MLISSTTSLFKPLNDKASLKMLSSCGFKAFDMSFHRMFENPDYEMNLDSYEEYMKELRSYADSLGIFCNQAHAPYASSKGDLGDEKRFEKILRAIHGASILGAKMIVVHPMHHIPYNKGKNPKILKEMNKEFYSRLIPYAENFNIKIGIENMWQYHKGRIWHSTCSNAEEFVDYIDMMDSEWIVGCLDIGHIALVNGNIPETIKKLGSRLYGLHIHDNDFTCDNHSLPYSEKINFEEFISALAEIGYQGDFTFEVQFDKKKLPAELYPDATKYLYKIGEMCVNNFLNKRK